MKLCMIGTGYSPAEALGAVLVAGVLFVIASITPLRAWIINSIPKSLKLGIGAGIGMFLAMIGFQIMGITVTTFQEGVPWKFQDPTLIKLGSLDNLFDLFFKYIFSFDLESDVCHLSISSNKVSVS